MLSEEYLTGWSTPLNPNEYPYCTKLKIGHCDGCHALQVVADRFRWQRRSPEEVAAEVAQEHCPPGLSPNVDRIVNTLASSGMGQTSEENTIFERTQPDRNGHKLHGHY